MNDANTRIQTPLAKARGFGSAKSGVDHWIKQRLTALANIGLVTWFIYALISLPLNDYNVVYSWVQSPVNAVLLILLIISVFKHAVLGSEVIIEDYVHHKGFKFFKLVAIKFTYFALGVACIFSILKIAL